MDATSIRRRNLERLGPRFRVASSLPLPDLSRKVRGAGDVASRLLALYGVFSWAAIGWRDLADGDIRARIERDDLLAAATDDEREILATERQEAISEYGGNIGWRLENMWPLAWALGHEPEPPPDGRMIDTPAIEAMLEFLRPREGKQALVARAVLRHDVEVIELEDLFYCAHNAGRSAQLGSDTVPEDFHPIAGTGVVHERRHALTWLLSPGVAWDETDLST